MINTRICFLVAARRGGSPLVAEQGQGAHPLEWRLYNLFIWRALFYNIYKRTRFVYHIQSADSWVLLFLFRLPKLWFVSHLRFGFLHYTVQDHLASGRFRHVSMISTKTGLSSTPTDQCEKRNRGHICRTLKEKPNQNWNIVERTTKILVKNLRQARAEV